MFSHYFRLLFSDFFHPSSADDRQREICTDARTASRLENPPSSRLETRGCARMQICNRRFCGDGPIRSFSGARLVSISGNERGPWTTRCRSGEACTADASIERRSRTCDSAEEDRAVRSKRNGKFQSPTTDEPPCYR